MNAVRLPLFARIALRELRGGLRGFYVFIACIAIGAAAIAGVNSLARALTEGISAEGRVILGGDLAFSLIHREVNAEELRFLEEAGDVGQVATMRAMLRRSGGDGQALVELKAVDQAYPHGGDLLLEGGGNGQSLLAARNGVFGALVAAEVLDRLDLAIGQRVFLGAVELELRDVIRSEPDRLSEGVGFGPRAMVSLEALRASGLVREGSLITWTYRLRMPEGANGSGAMGRLRAASQELFPEAGWNIRSRNNASPSLSRNIERFSQFLTLVGLTALVVGGVGVANAVASFVDLKRPAIATLKCLGARRNLVFSVYLTQILALAALGVGLGLVVGAAMPFAAEWALADLLPLSTISLYPRELGIAALCGFLVTLSFALGPLGRARQMPASSLFADRAIASPLTAPPAFRIAQAVAFACLAGVAAFTAGDRELALSYVGAVIAAFVLLRLVSALIMTAARRLKNIRGTALRLAVRNIQRPGALTPSVVLSLGVGLTLLVALALIDTNLRSQLSGSVTERAPDFFFVDIQDAERAAFVDLVQGEASGGALDTVPMLRGRIVAIDDVPAAEFQGSSWALRGDRGLTYADAIPTNSSLTEGEWWPAGHEGEPLVSLDEEIAADLGLAIGDTLTVNVLGRNVTARIENLRHLEWESLSMNFVMVFSPNTFRGAPHAHLATLRLAEGSGRDAERAVVGSVTRAFPGITTISVRDAIESVNAIIADLALAVRVVASLALVVSMLVLGGALAAGHRQRRQDAVILKSLGATRGRLLSAFSLEYGLLGLATAVFAVAAGAAAAWYVVEELWEMEFSLMPSVALTAVALALAVTVGLGLAGTWRILSVKPAGFLKNL